MPRIVAFGEIMARMAPAGLLRLSQVLPGRLDVTFAGAEANVAASLAMLGATADFVTSLPQDSPLTGPCLSSLRGTGVGIQHIRQTDAGRFGIYFVESGANQRPTRVFYDRAFSAISLANETTFDWTSILQGADWLHLTGITPGLSATAADATLAAARIAHDCGVRVSFDVNYRSKLWRWDQSMAPAALAAKTLRTLLPHIDLLFAGDDDLQLIGVPPVTGLNIPAGLPVPAERQIRAAQALATEFPNLQWVAGSLRIQHSASHNDWGGSLFETRTGQFLIAPAQTGESWQPWEIRAIVDRVGAGDAFDAGILFGLTQPGFSPQHTVEFATAAACLAHSVAGDWNYASRAEIEDLISGGGSGRIVR